LGERVLVAVLAAVAAALLMGSVALAPADRVYGLPSDPLGEVWRLSQFDSGEIALVGDDVSHEANVPSGVPLRRPADASQVLYDAPAAVLAMVLGPVPAYSLLVFLAFWTTAVAGYGAARSLSVGRLGSALTGGLFTLTPVHMLEAQLHVGLAFVFMLPVLVVLGVRVIERPSSRGGALFAGALGLCAYITAYLFLEALAVAVGVAAAAVVLAVTDGGARAPLAHAVGAAVLVLGVLLAPLLVVLATHHGGLAPELNRSLADVATFSLPLSAYLDPRTSLLGAVGVALALAGLVWGRASQMARRVLGLVASAGILISLRPELSLLGLDVPMPSKLIHSVIPYWRVFGRVSIVVALAGALLAAIALDRLATDRRPFLRLAAIGLAVVAVADLIEHPPPAAADRGQPDPVAEVLAKGRGAVAEYPLFGFDNDQLGVYLFRQLRHRKRLLNGSVTGTLAADLAGAAAAANAQEAREALTLAGVRDIAVHPGSPSPEGRGFRLVTRTPDGTRVFRVSPSAAPTVATVRGGYTSEPGPDGTPFQWLPAGAVIRVVADRSGPATLRFTAVSVGVPRATRFGATKRRVSTVPIPIDLCVAVGGDRVATVPITTDPAPAQLPGGDARVAGIGVYHLRADPGCR